MVILVIFLFRDNVPTICLAQWPMEATLWDGDLIAGPVPTLFTEEVEAGTKAILEVKFDKSKYSKQIINNSKEEFFI